MPKKATVLRLARSALVLKVTLREVSPPVWRRLRVAGDLTLRELHHVLQIAMGWTDSHLHEFEVDGRRYGMPDPEEDLGEPPLDEQDHPLHRMLRKGDRAEYSYDFGDGWRHEILVEDAITPDAGAAKAECLAGARACPPRGLWRPPWLRRALEAIADPSTIVLQEAPPPRRRRGAAEEKRTQAWSYLSHILITIDESRALLQGSRSALATARRVSPRHGHSLARVLLRRRPRVIEVASRNGAGSLLPVSGI